MGDLVLTVNDDIQLIGDRIYVKATATITDGDNTISNSAFARESLTKKGMDDSQVTGTASSYARKYALNGLLCIDDTKDADSMDNRKNTAQTDMMELHKDKINKLMEIYEQDEQGLVLWGYMNSFLVNPELHQWLYANFPQGHKTKISEKLKAGQALFYSYKEIFKTGSKDEMQECIDEMTEKEKMIVDKYLDHSFASY